MNPGTFQGAGTGTTAGGVTRYVQTSTITTSQTITPPSGTLRIEALLVGGGGGGGTDPSRAGGGFGGAAIIEIPVTGSPLQVVVGAGGSANTDGSPTYVVSAGTRYAEVGGGGGGQSSVSPSAPAAAKICAGFGRSGGGGGGSPNNGFQGAPGGPAPIGNILWSIYPQSTSRGFQTDADNNVQLSLLNSTQNTSVNADLLQWGPASVGVGGFMSASALRSTSGIDGSLGGGGGGGGYGCQGGYGGGGAVLGSGNFGGGGGQDGGSGGSLTSVSIWGYTGRAGGAAGGDFNYGGGGGGLLGAGAAGATGTGGGAGGNGGGGGGGGRVSPNVGGTGGNGFAALRFYF